MTGLIELLSEVVHDVFKLIFIGCIFAVVLHYILYPIVIIGLAKLKRVFSKSRPLPENTDLPSVTFIIAAYNEEKVIKSKLENTLEIDYPSDKFEIIVVSDGSDDNTNEIANSFDSVVAMHQPERRGKSNALNRAVDKASGEILILSDANNYFDKDSVKKLVSHFVDDSVGIVTGAKGIYENKERQAAMGDGLYWKYESAIKQAESDLGSTCAADGEMLAIRRRAYRPIPDWWINDDAWLTLEVKKAGFRVLYDSTARCYEEASHTLAEDFSVKVRMTYGGYQTIFSAYKDLIRLLWPFGLSFLLHKILRWLSPVFLLITLLLSAYFAHFVWGAIFMAFEYVFYFIALSGLIWPKLAKQYKVVYIASYFVCMNTAMLMGLVRFLRADRSNLWVKASR